MRPLLLEDGDKHEVELVVVGLRRKLVMLELRTWNNLLDARLLVRVIEVLVKDDRSK